jgi:hypothetical protein
MKQLKQPQRLKQQHKTEMEVFEDAPVADTVAGEEEMG